MKDILYIICEGNIIMKDNIICGFMYTLGNDQVGIIIISTTLKFCYFLKMNALNSSLLFLDMQCITFNCIHSSVAYNTRIHYSY